MAEYKFTPSPKQKKMIGIIKDMLGKKFTGSSQDDLSKFFDENIAPAMEKLKDRPPSDKQVACIAKMERALNVKFEGTTGTQASEFISANMKSYREMFKVKGIKK